MMFDNASACAASNNIQYNWCTTNNNCNPSATVAIRCITFRTLFPRKFAVKNLSTYDINCQQGLKNPFLSPGRRVVLSWGQVVPGRRTNWSNNVVPNRALLTPEIRPFHLAKKCRKISDFNVEFWKLFWRHSPQTPILGRVYSAPPQTSPPQRSVPPAPGWGASAPP